MGTPSRRCAGRPRVRKLAEELTAAGHPASPQKVGRLLEELGYSLQSNQKTHQGTVHPDRNAQFEFINAHTEEFQAAGQPVISADTKKKELVRDFKNGGRDGARRGNRSKFITYMASTT